MVWCGVVRDDVLEETKDMTYSMPDVWRDCQCAPTPTSIPCAHVCSDFELSGGEDSDVDPSGE